MEFDNRCCAFFNLLKKPKIQRLLKFDTCCTIADRYHLATVFYLFLRANFLTRDYNERNFHLALYLSHDIQEDIDCFKECIVDNLISRLCAVEDYVLFMLDKLDLFFRLNCNVLIDKEACELLFYEMPHTIWKRVRSEDHAGVLKELICDKCSHKYVV